MNKDLVKAVGFALMVVFIVMGLASKDAIPVQGSVEISSEYTATSTDSSWPTTVCKNGVTAYKTLGSVVVTNTSNADLYIYDATTTGPHADHPTTTIAAFPATTVGTYTFDVVAQRGICVVAESSVGIASTTITVR